MVRRCWLLGWLRKVVVVVVGGGGLVGVGVLALMMLAC
jgi:hypothetical protein